MATVTATFTGYPTSYDEQDYRWRAVENLENGYTPSSSTTDAKIYTTVGKSSETWIYYKFDTSSIPDGATITSVSCSARAHYYGSTISSTRYLRMYSGTTAKGSSSTISTNVNTTYNLTVGDWTLSELRNARIKLYGMRGTGSSANTVTSHYLAFRGATLTVTYSYEQAGQDVFYKQNGSWVQAEKVFYKTNGSWVEVEGMFVKDNGTWES